MKFPLSRNYLIFGICFATAMYMVTQGQGCSGQVASSGNSAGGTSLSSNSGNSSGDLGVAPPPADDMPVIPNSKTVSVVYSKQILEQYTTCLGVKASDRTVAMYENKKGAVSVYGTANTITSPMMMAVLSISGEICQDLVLQEAAASSKRIFKEIDLNANLAPGDAAVKMAISRLALACWQRKETASEAQNLSGMVSSSVGATEAQGGRKAALMICTSMLSSLDAMAN